MLYLLLFGFLKKGNSNIDENLNLITQFPEKTAQILDCWIASWTFGNDLKPEITRRWCDGNIIKKSIWSFPEGFRWVFTTVPIFSQIIGSLRWVCPVLSSPRFHHRRVVQNSARGNHNQCTNKERCFKLQLQRFSPKAKFGLFSSKLGFWGPFHYGVFEINVNVDSS